MLDKNTKVTGKYYGQEIGGTVIENRNNYRTGKRHITVLLDSPITVWGNTRGAVSFDSIDKNGIEVGEPNCYLNI